MLPRIQSHKKGGIFNDLLIPEEIERIKLANQKAAMSKDPTQKQLEITNDYEEFQSQTYEMDAAGGFGASGAPSLHRRHQSHAVPKHMQKAIEASLYFSPSNMTLNLKNAVFHGED